MNNTQGDILENYVLTKKRYSHDEARIRELSEELDKTSVDDFFNSLDSNETWYFLIIQDDEEIIIKSLDVNLYEQVTTLSWGNDNVDTETINSLDELNDRIQGYIADPPKYLAYEDFLGKDHWENRREWFDDLDGWGYGQVDTLPITKAQYESIMKATYIRYGKIMPDKFHKTNGPTLGYITDLEKKYR